MSNVRFSNVLQIEDLMAEQVVNANAERKAWAEELEAKEREEQERREQRAAMLERRDRCFAAMDKYRFWQQCARAGGIVMMMICVVYAVMSWWGYAAASTLCIAFFYWVSCFCSRKIQKLRRGLQKEWQ